MNNSVNKKPLLGIIGGLGPMASAYFLESVTAHTKALCDQDHINIILSSHSETPDRTSYILGNSTDSPLPYMIEDAKRLEQYGANFLLMPCNTAHYFIDELRKSVSIPVPSIIEETCDYLLKNNIHKVGIMATAGTIYSNSYQDKLIERNIKYIIPDDDMQNDLNSLIYEDVKRGSNIDINKFLNIINKLKLLGAEKIVLGCTELSVINRLIPYDSVLVDSLEVLACKAIKLCGCETINFPEDFKVIK